MTARPTSTLALTALLLAGPCPMAGASQAGTPAEPGNPFEPAAECVAVLKQDLKPRLHLQPTAQENDQWKQQAESAFAFAGGAYHAGVSEEQAQQMLDNAEERVAAWAPEKVSRQAGACSNQGSQLLARATPIEKIVVRSAAKRWLARQLRRLEP